MTNRWWLSLMVLLTTPMWLHAEGTWQQVPGNGPAPRRGHSICEIDGQAYIYGGVADGADVRNDLWAFNVDQEIWTEFYPPDPKPEPRYGHKATAVNGKMYIFSGMVAMGYEITDAWCYDPQANTWTWVVSNNDWPNPRIDYSMVAIDNKLYVFGGASLGGTIIDNHLWSYNLDTQRWYRKTGSDTVTPRYGHYAGVVGGKMYVIGGSDGEQPYGDILIYDPVTNGWIEIQFERSSPVPLYYQSGITDGEDFWIAGGRDGQGNDLGGTWKYDVTQNAWTQQPEGPIHAYGGAVPVFDADNNVSLFLFGGERNGQVLGETWLFTPDVSPADVKPSDTNLQVRPAPNPSNGIIYFKDREGSVAHLEGRIYNMNEQVVGRFRTGMADIRDLPNGTYIAQSDEGSWRIVKGDGAIRR